MPPDSFGTQLLDALARNTPAFQPAPRPARHGFVRQLMDALARNTPAFQAGPAPAQPLNPGDGAATQPRRSPAREHRVRQTAPPYRWPTGGRPSQWPTAGPQPGRAEAQMVADKGRFLTVAEVASVMRVKKSTVYRLVHTGHLPAVRVGRSLRVPEQAVHHFLQERLRDVS